MQASLLWPSGMDLNLHLDSMTKSLEASRSGPYAVQQLTTLSGLWSPEVCFCVLFQWNFSISYDNRCYCLLKNTYNWPQILNLYIMLL